MVQQICAASSSKIARTAQPAEGCKRPCLQPVAFGEDCTLHGNFGTAREQTHCDGALVSLRYLHPRPAVGVGQEVFHPGAQAPEQALQSAVARGKARLQVVGIRPPRAGEHNPATHVRVS